MNKKTFVTIVGLMIFLTSCAKENEKTSPGIISGDLIVFHAGSLAVPFKEIKNEFIKKKMKNIITSFKKCFKNIKHSTLY